LLHGDFICAGYIYANDGHKTIKTNVRQYSVNKEKE